MASDISLWATSGERDLPGAGIDAALSVFSQVETACTRFNPFSPLMRANAEPHLWHEVPETLYRAVQEAHRAYTGTRGLFDPRVLGDLVSLGYDRSLPFDTGVVVTPNGGRARPPLRAWRPRFRAGPPRMVHLGGVPIDLGGIGKGLAVRWAAERLDGLLGAYLLDAGGDCICRGDGPARSGWRVAVEDPCGDEGPLAVLELLDVACATSSIRIRRWRSGERRVHHLIDPRTGEPGGSGLLAVTVLAEDPANAEVLSKALFLSGREGIWSSAHACQVAALWVDTRGVMSESGSLAPHVIWRRT
jgi:thiamine biosynthesis lipoprotein